MVCGKCVEDASEYIWLRLEARSLLIGKSQSVKLMVCGLLKMIYKFSAREVFWLVNRKVSNWIVFRDTMKSDILLDVWHFAIYQSIKRKLILIFNTHFARCLWFKHDDFDG